MWLSVCTWVCAGVYVFPGRTRALNEARPATRYIPPVWLALRRLIKTGLVHGSNTDRAPTPRPSPHPPCNSHHSLGLWGIFSHLSVFPSFRFSFTPFHPQSFEFFFFFFFFFSSLHFFPFPLLFVFCFPFYHNRNPSTQTQLSSLLKHNPQCSAHF